MAFIIHSRTDPRTTPWCIRLLFEFGPVFTIHGDLPADLVLVPVRVKPNVTLADVATIAISQGLSLGELALENQVTGPAVSGSDLGNSRETRK